MSYNDWNILLRLFLDIYQAYHLVGLFLALLSPYLTSAINSFDHLSSKPSRFLLFLTVGEGKACVFLFTLKALLPWIFFLSFPRLFANCFFCLVYSICWQLVHGKTAKISCGHEMTFLASSLTPRSQHRSYWNDGSKALYLFLNRREYARCCFRLDYLWKAVHLCTLIT
jgi:hypothetical protein